MRSGSFGFHFLSWFPGWSEESPVTQPVRSIIALQVSISSRCPEMWGGGEGGVGTHYEYLKQNQ